MECWVKFKAVSEDNVFMLERLIEMVKGRKEEILVAFLDMEKAYDRVNRKKLFEVMRCYGVHEKLVRLIERIHDGSMVKFELEKVTTGWCKSDSGVRQGYPLSSLLFNIYVRELGNVISNCVHMESNMQWWERMVSWNGRVKQDFYMQIMCV